MGEEAEVDLRAPDAFTVGLAKEFAVTAVDRRRSLGPKSLLPDEAARNDDGETKFLPETREEVRAVVVGRAYEGDAAVAVLVAPAGGRREVDRGLVGGLNLEDIACAVLAVFDDVLVPLHDVEVEVSEIFFVEAPAGIAAHAKDVVDHVAGADNAHAAQPGQSVRLEREQLVGPEDVGALALRDCEDGAIEACDPRADLCAMNDLSQD